MASYRAQIYQLLLDVTGRTDSVSPKKLKKQRKERKDTMKKRFKESRKKSKKVFRKTAGNEHKFNNTAPIMRGGFRL